MSTETIDDDLDCCDACGAEMDWEDCGLCEDGDLATLIGRDWLIDPEVPAQATEPGKCPNCGLPMPKGFKFCGGDACIPF